MARKMVAKILDEGVPCAFVLADALYSSDYKFRTMLEERGQPYVLAVRSNQMLRFIDEWRFVQTDPATLIADLEAKAWQPLSAGEGAKGPRLYDWVRLPLKGGAQEGFSRWLMARRSQRDPNAIAYYFAHAPIETTLAELAAAAGLRWTIEECFLRAKDDLGLDHCEARSWHGWHRHMRLVMAAAAFLTKIAAEKRRSAFGKRNESTARKRGRMTTALAENCTTPEILRLVGLLLLRHIWPPTFILEWSYWRRRHQAIAAIAHRKSRRYAQL